MEESVDEDRFTEPDDFPLLREDRIRLVRVDADQQEPDGVRADVHEADDPEGGGVYQGWHATTRVRLNTSSRRRPFVSARRRSSSAEPCTSQSIRTCRGVAAAEMRPTTFSCVRSSPSATRRIAASTDTTRRSRSPRDPNTGWRRLGWAPRWYRATH